MTLVQCANALGITNPALSQWEQGKREPKYAMLLSLCQLFGSSPNELLGFGSVGGGVTVHGGTNAIGTGAKVNIQNFNPGESPQCAKCQYRKQLEKLKKLISP